jgi:translation initiation factor IF-3
MVIDETGQQLGKIPTAQALALARDKNLDLVEVGPQAQPPIVKIMDYGKYIYQKEKQEKKSQAKHKEQENKTIRIGYKTGDHDLKVRAKKINEFLSEGHIVRVELTLRGREKGMAHIGKDKLLAFVNTLTEAFVVMNIPQRTPYGWAMLIQKDKKAPQNQNQ